MSTTGRESVEDEEGLIIDEDDPDLLLIEIRTEGEKLSPT
jgi:hypothetical protein